MTDTLTHESDGLIPLLPYYVYVLMDPRDNSVFYVGKGQGNRAHAHVQEHDRVVRQGVIADGPKMQRISDIRAENLAPIQLVVARYETESEAYAVEATLIKWVYGFGELTNKVEGHGSQFIRTKGQHGTITGIDIPAPERCQDGSFRDEKVAALFTAEAFELQESLRAKLTEAGFEVRDFSAKEDKPFDPGTSNGWLALLVRIGSIDFCVQFSKTCKPAVLIANTLVSRTDAAKAQMERIEAIKGPQFRVGEPVNQKVKGEGRYRHFDPRPIFDERDLEGPVRLLEELQIACSS